MRSVTNLYNERPTWLDGLHKTLNAAVLTAYGWPSALTDDELLERLLGLNKSRPSASAKDRGQPRGVAPTPASASL